VPRASSPRLARVAQACAAAALLALCEGVRAEPRLLVAADGFYGGGATGAMSVRPPFEFRAGFAPTGAGGVVRVFRGEAFVVSKEAGTVDVLDAKTGAPLRTLELGAGSEPQDIAVVDATRAYVTRAGAAELLRVDPRTGASAPSTDLGLFADADGVPDLSMMAIHRRRLFVQVQRRNADAPGGLAPPGMIAVVDLDTEALVDTDPGRDGAQAIELQGTSPKHKMQLVPRPPRLFVSASGGFFDAGGLEAIDLATLRSLGLVLREADGEVGADLGSFVMTSPDAGFLVFSTDFDLSSHLVRFTVEGGVDPGPQLFVTVGYAVPALGYHRRTRRLFYPNSFFGDVGVHVFDARTGARLTEDAVPVPGTPTDLSFARRGTRTWNP
jgi:hypothetical protein